MLRERVRGARMGSSVPLLVFGVLTLMSAPFADDISVWKMLYWAVAGPAGFLAVASWYRWYGLRSGIRFARAEYLQAGLALLAAFVFVLPLTAMQIPTIAVFLLVIARRNRDTYLAVFAVAFGVIGGIEQGSRTFENLLYNTADGLGMFTGQDGYFDGASAIVTAAAALVLLVGGCLALRRERRAADER